MFPQVPPKQIPLVKKKEKELRFKNIIIYLHRFFISSYHQPVRLPIDNIIMYG